MKIREIKKEEIYDVFEPPIDIDSAHVSTVYQCGVFRVGDYWEEINGKITEVFIHAESSSGWAVFQIGERYYEQPFDIDSFEDIRFGGDNE